MEKYNMEEMQKVQLEMLKDVLQVCDKNEIPIYLAYGTAIGAIRHNGFIPWDDDIDLFVLQKDRARLREACQNELPDYYFYQTPETDAEYGLAIDRIRNSNTTLIEESEKNRHINHGIFLDIYPLFSCADGKVGYYTQYISRYLYRLLLYGEKPHNKGGLITTLSGVMLKIFPSGLKKRIIENNSDYVEKKGGIHFLASFYGNDAKLKYDRKCFAERRWVQFEDLQVPLAVGMEQCLTDYYGDYMQLPPEEKRTVHHDYAVVDCQKSYKNYINRMDE